MLLAANKIFDPIDPADTALSRVEGTDLFALTLQLPDAYLGSYPFSAPDSSVPGPTLHGAVNPAVMGAFRASMVSDPHARETTTDKPDAPSLAVARGPEAPTRRLATRGGDPSTIALVPLPSPVNETPLSVRRWSSDAAGPDSPVLLLLDGEVWHRVHPIAPELARRVEVGDMPPPNVILRESGGPQQRELDYTADLEPMRSLLESVRSLADMSPTALLVLAGQSLGGLFTAPATTRPELVAAAVAQPRRCSGPRRGCLVRSEVLGSVSGLLPLSHPLWSCTGEHSSGSWNTTWPWPPSWCAPRERCWARTGRSAGTMHCGGRWYYLEHLKPH